MNWSLFCTIVLIITMVRVPSPANNYDALYNRADSLYSIDQTEQALGLFKEAYSVAKSDEAWNGAVDCLIKVSYCTFELNKSDKEKNNLKNELAFLLRQKNIDLQKIANYYLAQSYNFMMEGAINESLVFLEKTINIYEKNNSNNKNVAYAYLNAAQIYLRRLDYDKSLNYLQKALISDSTNTHTASIYVQLANYYSLLEDPENTLVYCEKALSAKPDEYDKADAEAMSAVAYIEKENFKKAINLLNNSTSFYESDPYSRENLLRNYLDYARIYLKLKNVKKEGYYYLKAIEEAKKFAPVKNRETARVLANYGDFHLRDGDLNSAIEHYQLAMIQVFPNFNELNINENPSLKDAYLESWAMTSAAKKGSALLRKYKLAKDLNLLLNASHAYDLSIACIQKIKESYGTDGAKIYLSDFGHSEFEDVIEINYLLFINTKEKKYLDKIFSVMERSKASVLTEAIQKNEALILADIPDSLLQQEKNLRLELAEINTNIKKEELYEAEADQAYISKMRSRSVTQQRKYEALLEELKNNYPAFNSFTQNPDTPTLSEIQNYLAKKNETLLEYFVGQKNIYLIKINQHSTNIFQIPHTDFWNDQVSDYQDYFRNSAAIINDPDGYFSVSEKLYQQVFPFDTLPEKIIIIPDEALNFIPFDALVASTPEQANFNEAEFLIKNHLIRYAYSSGLLTRSSSEKKQHKKMLRVEPMFVNRERGQAPLYIRQENGSNIKGMQTLAGAAARLSTFKEWAPQCRLIEFFTHAGADETDFAPRIEFIDTSLYLPELYAMDIPAELVVLSACETGLGKFEKGEGVMSLARGFAYAGASDLVASLWKVNEGSTADLTNYFYQHLMAGSSKSSALRAAKLQYFAEADSDEKLSPYYWAGFISIGPDAVMDFSQKQWQWWLLAGALLLCIILWWRSRKR
ncbi:MAG: CHAT domain-containing protein [Bacteroidota bacterium]